MDLLSLKIIRVFNFNRKLHFQYIKLWNLLRPLQVNLVIKGPWSNESSRSSFLLLVFGKDFSVRSKDYALN